VTQLRGMPLEVSLRAIEELPGCKAFETADGVRGRVPLGALAVPVRLRSWVVAETADGN
jgi:hypothetical protein